MVFFGFCFFYFRLLFKLNLEEFENKLYTQPRMNLVQYSVQLNINRYGGIELFSELLNKWFYRAITFVYKVNVK